jgi:hypothetical protein
VNNLFAFALRSMGPETSEDLPFRLTGSYNANQQAWIGEYEIIAGCDPSCGTCITGGYQTQCCCRATGPVSPRPDNYYETDFSDS